MKFDLTITKQDFLTLLESEVLTETVNIDEVPMGTITVGGSGTGTPAGTVSSVIKILKLLAAYKKFFWVQKTMAMDKSKIYYVNIVLNSTTNFIAQPLRNLGLMLNNLLIGVDFDHYRIYLTNKLVKDLSKFSKSLLDSICLYLYSIGFFFKTLVNLKKEEDIYNNIKYEEYSDLLILNSQSVAFLNASLAIFGTEDINFEVLDMPEEYKMCALYKNSRTNYVPVYVDNSPVKGEAAVLITSKDCGIITSYGKQSLNKTLILLKAKEIITNQPINLLDLGAESRLGIFCSLYNKTIPISYDPNLKIDVANEPEIIVSNLDETTEDLKAFSSILNALDGFLDTEFDVSRLEKALSIKVKKVGFSALDPNEMRENYKNDEYAQNLYLQEQSYFNNVNLMELENIVKGFAKGDVYSMIFIGESGTGKSTAARVIPTRCGIPFLAVNFSANIEESDLFGTMIPNAEKQKPEEPEFIWKDGLITRAIRNGYCIILEELNFARPSVLGKLNSLLDESRQIDLPNGELLKAHPNFRIIATCNIAYEGTNRFNKALINRFEICKVFEELDKAEVMKIIESRTGFSNKDKMEKVYMVYEAIRKYATEQNLNLVVSLRQLLNIFRQRKYYKSAKEAVMLLMVNEAFIEEPGYKDFFITTVLSAFDLDFKL